MPPILNPGHPPAPMPVPDQIQQQSAPNNRPALEGPPDMKTKIMSFVANHSVTLMSLGGAAVGAAIILGAVALTASPAVLVLGAIIFSMSALFLVLACRLDPAVKETVGPIIGALMDNTSSAERLEEEAKKQRLAEEAQNFNGSVGEGIREAGKIVNNNENPNP